MELRDQVVVIAGATGCIGSAFAKLVLARGARVAAAVRRPWQVAKLHEALGHERLLIGVVAPTDAEAAAGFAKGANDALGPVTAFVGAASRWRPRVDGQEPDSDLAEALEANVSANATLARAVLPFLRRKRRGSLAFAGRAAEAMHSGSVASQTGKAALHGYVTALARELDGTGVRAAAVLLGDSAAPHDDAAAALAAAAFGEPRAGGPLFQPAR